MQTVKDIELLPTPSYVKRHPIGDGLVLAVHPSGRMVWQRSTRQGGKLQWITFGVHKPRTDKDWISEQRARTLNEDFIEKRDLGIATTENIEAGITFGVAVQRYLKTFGEDQAVTKAGYIRDFKRLEKLYPIKWSLLNETAIEKAITEYVDGKKDRLKNAERSFAAIIRLSNVSHTSVTTIPKKTLFLKKKFKDLGLGVGDRGNHPAIINGPDYKELYKKLLKEYEKDGRLSLAALIIIANFPKRPGEIAKMKWEHINFERKEIHFGKGHEKTKSWEMIYPMSDYVSDFLYKMYETRMHETFVFCLRMNKPMTTSAFGMELRKHVVENTQSVHGMRASFRSIGLDLNYNIMDMELTLGHTFKDALKGAYERIRPQTRLAQRRKLANDWSKYLND